MVRAARECWRTRVRVEAMKIEVVKGVYGHLSLNVRQHARARLRSLRAALPGRAPATMAELGQRVEAVAESIMRDEARQLGVDRYLRV